MIRVMIADDNVALNKLYEKYLTKDEEIEIVYIATDGKEALTKYKELKPDVLLLDLQLPSLSGVDIINNLSLNSSERNKCNIIVISGNDSLRFNIFNTSKIFKIIPKPMEIEDVVYSIKEMFKKTELTKNEIYLFLKSLNFNLFADGTKYLVEAIFSAYNRPFLLKNFEKLYSKISIKFSISHSRVKWGIRNSLDTMYKKTSYEDVNLALNTRYKGKLTPKQFIPLTVYYYREQFEYNKNPY